MKSQERRLKQAEDVLKPPDEDEYFIVNLRCSIVGEGGKVLEVREKRVEIDSKWLNKRRFLTYDSL